MVKEIAIWGGLLVVALLLGFAGTRTPRSVQADAPEVPGHEHVTFDVLASYPYTVPEPGSPEPTGQIPSEIYSLDGKSVLVVGFVVPLDVLDGRVPEFYLSRFPQGCCFGRPVDANELVYVDLGREAVPYRPHRPVWLRGRLEVAERRDAVGYLTHLYRLTEASVVRVDGATEHDPEASGLAPGRSPLGADSLGVDSLGADSREGETRRKDPTTDRR